jgi:hypothetical protein
MLMIDLPLCDACFIAGYNRAGMQRSSYAYSAQTPAAAAAAIVSDTQHNSMLQHMRSASGGTVIHMSHTAATSKRRGSGSNSTACNSLNNMMLCHSLRERPLSLMTGYEGSTISSTNNNNSSSSSVISSGINNSVQEQSVADANNSVASVTDAHDSDVAATQDESSAHVDQ